MIQKPQGKIFTMNWKATATKNLIPKGMAMLVAGMSFAMLISCKDASKGEETPQVFSQNSFDLQLTDEQIKMGSIQLATPVRESISNTMLLNGKIDVPPDNLVSITTPMGGYVRTVKVYTGQRVSKGEVLITMSDPAYIQLQQDFLVSKSKLVYLQQEYNRQKALSESQASSVKAYQQISAEMQVEQVNMAALRQKLNLIGINTSRLNAGNIVSQIALRSPINGFVTATPVNKGRYVNPTEVLAELVDPTDIHAELTVFEKDINHIKIGQEVKVNAVSATGDTFPARVILVSHNIDENRRGYVHCHFGKYHAELLPGMAIVGEVHVDRNELPVISENAVVMHSGKHYVFREVSPKNFRLTEVQTGNRHDGQIALTNNNIDWTKEKVVVSGAFNMLGILMGGGEEE